eukprot:TRINITY_DN14746_c0_g1_i1.p1 TRINITY_DN14746_c0_g1~~TRINITY_DN14746_c0_g1_i1.p1  ORF type:complete len:574 (-),score=117.09 TRINITY_DN14746_c0_g1_i1:88-1809(-)
MTRKKTGGALGNSIVNDRRRKDEEKTSGGYKVTGVSQHQAKKSVLEQNSLDDFIASAELANADFHSLRGEAFEMISTPEIISLSTEDAATRAEREEAAKQVIVPIPWRPKWQEGMEAEELVAAEGEAFLKWRRKLAKMEEQDGFTMTPYERNLDFWRQLWRCVDRSDVVVQILDTRDPEFYVSKDLVRYVQSFEGKRHMLVLNKADFLSAEQRRNWSAYLADRGVEAIFFSALRELTRQQSVPLTSSSAGGLESDSEDDGDDNEENGDTEEPSATAKLPPHGPLAGAGMTDVADCKRLIEELQARLPAGVGEGGSRRGVVGFVGYPNVGKSSVINALFGAKKVSMSRTPGKTKHLQTLELADSGITLCDCPGLVFPSVVATKAQLTINGTVPITELKDFFSPVALVVEKIGADAILRKYGVSESEVKDGAIRRGVGGENDAMAHQVLCGIATHRQHFLRVGVPDETWAARRILRDYCTGSLLHCEPPPGQARGPVEAPAASSASRPTEEEENSDSDFSDLEDFLNESAGMKQQRVTKRKMRQLNKQMLKGGVKEKPQPKNKAFKDIRGKNSLG